MKKNDQKEMKQERGNALVYVLIAICLFAALSFVLGKQTDTSEGSAISEDKAELYATQLISYSAQAKSAVDQMVFSGTKLDNLDFTLPTESGFNTAPPALTNKVFHPDGGGLSPGRLPAEAVAQNSTDPTAGWYIGRFNNVEWTKTAGTDVVLVAYQINKKVCEKINEKAVGSDAIPVMGDSIKETMINDAFHTGVNTDLTTDPTGSPVCADCHKRASICVEDQGGGRYAFFTVLEDR